MDPSKRTGVGFPFAPTSAALVLCALMSATSTLTASVVPISSITNRGAESGSLTFGDGTVQDVTRLLAINTGSFGTPSLVGLGEILKNAETFRKNDDLALFSYGTLFLSGSGSNGPDTLDPGNFAFTGATFELGPSNFTELPGIGVGQVSAWDAGFAGFGADRAVSLGGWDVEAVTLLSASNTGNERALTIMTASTYALDGGSSTSGSEILAGTGSTMTKTPVEPDAVTAIKTWDAGAGAGNWGSANNWNSNGVPGSGDDVRFDNTGQSPLEDIFLNGNRSINSLTIDLTAGSNQNWNLGADDSNNAYTLTLATGNISVLSTSGTGTYIIGATSGNNIGPGIMTLATSGTGFTFDNSRTNGGLLQINAIISGSSKTVTKTGAGTVILSRANTFTGATTVNGGTLILASSSGGALGFTSGITVNSGGTLLLGANNQINNLASLTLAGGTFARGNFSEGSTISLGLGALNLTAAGSHLDFGTGTVGIITFASFAPGSFTLTIDNWTGTANTVGDGLTDRLIFASNQSGNLGSFDFTGFAPGAVQFDLLNGYWEIVPVPEAGTFLSGSAVLVLILFHHRRQFRQLIRRLHASRKLRFSTAHGTGVAS